MLLYRYLLHYGLLLHIMSQYLCLFSLILQGLHEEGEYRQLEFWAGKGANIRDLLCTTPRVLKLHESQFWNILKILGEERTRGGPLSRGGTWRNQSSWPNQTKVSEKKYEAITIMHRRVQQTLK